MQVFEPEVRYSIEELLARFKLKIEVSKYVGQRTKIISEVSFERNRAWTVAYKWLRDHAMIKAKYGPDKSGWIEIRCPWVDEHTDRADTGAAIRKPAEENDYYGAFQCHHGHCKDKTWREQAEWIGDEAGRDHAEPNDPGFDVINAGELQK